jgi:putative DNA primase/helicase
MSFKDYVEAGWVLCSIHEGQKRPRGDGWNKRENGITSPAIAQHLVGAGLCHAYSGTCAIDIDNVDLTRVWMRERGIDLDALMKADDAVQIVRGDNSRGKLIYKLPEPLPTKQIKQDDIMLLEFRCGATTGNSAQDVLPPTIHPRGQAYAWKYNNDLADWRAAPPLPEALHKLWLSMVRVEPRLPSTAVQTRVAPNLQWVRDLLASRDPDCDYDTWRDLGMRLHEGTDGGDDGFALWNEWSAGGSKYPGEEALAAKWDTFGRGTGPQATLAGLRQEIEVPDEAFGPPLTQDQLDAAAKAYGLRASMCPVITLEGGKLDENASRCEGLLASELYVRDRGLVRIGAAHEKEDEDGTIRVDTQPIVIAVNEVYLQRRLTALVQFRRWDARAKDYVDKDCPKDLANAIAKYGRWPKLRDLRAIASAPFIRPDKTVCDVPGYDALSRTFYAPNATFPAVPEQPSQEDASKALAVLSAPFAQFPLEPAYRAAFFAHVLTEAVRPAIDTSPIFAYTAPQAATGKTKLASMPAHIVHGIAPALHPWPKEGDELRKALFASLLAGDRTLVLDNLQNGLRVFSPELCHFVTSAVYGDRKLGGSEKAAMPNQIVVALTGNNLTPAGDLARRSMVVRLDAGMDSPTLRERRFDIPDLEGHVREHRAELLVAALTIVRAYVVAGSPKRTTPLPSFEQWSRLVRDSLVWIGLRDPLDSQDAEADDESGAIGAALEAIAAWRGDEWFTAQELAAQAMFGAMGDALRAALVAAGCKSCDDAQHVGYWLRNARDRVHKGMKLTKRDTRSSSEWRLHGAVDPDSDIL